MMFLITVDEIYFHFAFLKGSGLGYACTKAGTITCENVP